MMIHSGGAEAAENHLFCLLVETTNKNLSPLRNIVLLKILKRILSRRFTQNSAKEDLLTAEALGVMR